MASESTDQESKGKNMEIMENNDKKDKVEISKPKKYGGDKYTAKRRSKYRGKISAEGTNRDTGH